MKDSMGRFDPLRKREIGAALLVVLMGGYISYYAYYTLRLGILIAPGAGFQPFFLGLALVILGIVWFVTLIRFKNLSPDGYLEDGTDEDDLGAAEHARSRKHILGFFLILSFAVLLERMGFILSVFAFMFCWQLIVEKARWTTGLLIALVTGGVMFVLFRLLLKLPLPRGYWFG